MADIDALVKRTEATLAPGEPSSEHEAVRRLHGDQLVVEAILDQGVYGPRHRELEEALIRYAVPVLLQQLAEGKIVSKATQLGRPPGDPEACLYFTKADREEFAYDMVADALPVFTKSVFEEERWSPDGGASLKTYFVNACTLQFSGLLRKWQDQRRTVRPVGLEPGPGNGGQVPSPALTVELRDEVASILAKITDRQIQEVLVLRAAGYTAEDAARRAGLTVKAAESRLGRIRKGLRAGCDGDDDVAVAGDPASVAGDGKSQNRPDEAGIAGAYRPGQDQRSGRSQSGACKEES